MLVRAVAAAVLSAVLMFFWGFVYWALLGGGAKTQSPLPVEKQLDLLAVLRTSGMETGMYIYPFPAEMTDEAATAEFNRQHEEGPVFQLAYRKEGGPAMDGGAMALGFANMALMALLTAGLTAMVAGSLPTFGRRFAFAMLIPVIASLWSNLGDVIWWLHPLRYAAGNILYQVVAGALMAVVVAVLVKPQSDASTA
ncbi:MAG: hypothetical protein CMJ58_13225 [Planctomycetaceae bacterium]|nr:hypothetical protein [Planctomycetaceae bacterium]